MGCPTSPGRDILVLVADRDGLSYYRLETIDREMGYPGWAELARARTCLIEMDLIAFEPHSEHDANGVYQVLGLVRVVMRRDPRGR